MTRSVPVFFYALSVLIFISSCNRQEPENKANGSTNGAAAVRVDSTDAPPLPQKPLAAKPVDEMTREERESYKDTLTKSGFYNCCIRPTCNMCLYEEEEACPCAKLLKSNDAVCGECQKGWLKGKGAIEGIDPKKVRRM